MSQQYFLSSIHRNDRSSLDRAEHEALNDVQIIPDHNAASNNRARQAQETKTYCFDNILQPNFAEFRVHTPQ